MLTYRLFKTQNMLLSATSRKGLPDADLQPVQNAPVRNKQEGPARCSLTCCSKPRALSSATHMKGQPKADLHPVQNQEHTPVSSQQEGLATCWLTSCSKSRACSCQQPAERASQMLTYILLKTHSMLLSVTSRKGQPDPDLQPVQNPGHTPVSNKQEGPARSWLTCCSKPRACSCQQQAWRASQMLTYSLFNTQSMISSATSRKGQQVANLLAVQSQSTLISNTHEAPAKC